MTGGRGGGGVVKSPPDQNRVYNWAADSGSELKRPSCIIHLDSRGRAVVRQEVRSVNKSCDVSEKSDHPLFLSFFLSLIHSRNDKERSIYFPAVN